MITTTDFDKLEVVPAVSLSMVDVVIYKNTLETPPVRSTAPFKALLLVSKEQPCWNSNDPSKPQWP
jgi:hypothetical protein